MVSLHTPGSSFSFISESLVSSRAIYEETQGQVGHIQTAGFIPPEHTP
jgi:hypothetical protein